YFPVMASSISIPPWSEPAQKYVERHWLAFRAIPKEAIVPTLMGMEAEKETGISVQEIFQIIMERREGRVQLATSEEDLRRQEYTALRNGRPEVSKDQDFVCVEAEGQGEVQDIFGQVRVVTRLREVRVLRGRSEERRVGKVVWAGHW